MGRWDEMKGAIFMSKWDTRLWHGLGSGTATKNAYWAWQQIGFGKWKHMLGLHWNCIHWSDHVSIHFGLQRNWRVLKRNKNWKKELEPESLIMDCSYLPKLTWQGYYTEVNSIILIPLSICVLKVEPNTILQIGQLWQKTDITLLGLWAPSQFKKSCAIGELAGNFVGNFPDSTFYFFFFTFLHSAWHGSSFLSDCHVILMPTISTAILLYRGLFHILTWLVSCWRKNKM